MLRWFAITLAFVAAVGVGLLLGHARWGRPSTPVEQTIKRSALDASEAAPLRAENQQLRERVESLTKEQERLAQQNDILRQQQATQEVLGGSGHELPPK